MSSDEIHDVEAHATAEALPLAADGLDVDPLGLDPQTMRELGYRAVDLVVDGLERLGSGPAVRAATRDEMERRLREPPPEQGTGFDEVLRRLATDVLPYASRGDHPRFFAFVPTSPTWPSVVGDLIATGSNIFQGAWLESAGPSQVELVVVDWFKEWLGLPQEAGGLLLSGGSAANMTALTCAADARLGPDRSRGTIYLSSQVHSSALRATRVLGFPRERLRVLPVDARHRLRLDLLARAVAEDRAAGLEPFFVVATAGTTNSGAVDPLPELADLAAEHGLWLHVDGAYGGFAALTERGRAALRGIERADSVTLDPHKWLYQPYEAGCLLVQDRRLLLESFRIVPDYLRDAEVSGDREVNFGDLGIQLTRSARALKVWVSLQYFGVGAFRRAIDRCLDLVQLAQEEVERSPELELVSPASLGVLCFRRRPAGVDDEDELARLNAELVSRVAVSGEGMLSSTRLDGRYVIRLCVLAHSTGPEDVLRVLRFVEREDVRRGSGAGEGEDVEAHGLGAPDAAEGLAGYRRHEDAESLGLPLYGE